MVLLFLCNWDIQVANWRKRAVFRANHQIKLFQEFILSSIYQCQTRLVVCGSSDMLYYGVVVTVLSRTPVYYISPPICVVYGYTNNSLSDSV